MKQPSDLLQGDMRGNQAARGATVKSSTCPGTRVCSAPARDLSALFAMTFVHTDLQSNRQSAAPRRALLPVKKPHLKQSIREPGGRPSCRMFYFHFVSNC
jgi:hypothetical protein